MRFVSMCAAALLATMALAAQAAPKQGAAQSAEKSAAARRTIVAWLECEECSEGELKAVVALGREAVPTLAATLREGPPPANREQHRRHLVRTFADLQHYAASKQGRKLELTEDQYVRLYMENFVALYRTRSAVALGHIGGHDSERALSEALERPASEVVKNAVRNALSRIRAQ